MNYITLGKFSIRFNGIFINLIKVQILNFTFQLKNISIKIYLFKKQKIFITSDLVSVYRSSENNNPVTKAYGYNNSFNIKNKISQIFNLCGKFRLIGLKFNKVNILDLYSLEDVLIISENINFKIIKINEYSIDLTANIILKNSSFKFFFNNHNFDNKISFRELNGKYTYDIFDKVNIYSDFKIEMLSINNKNVSKAPIVFEFIDVNLNIKLEDNKINISDDSCIHINNIKINISQIIDLNDIDFFNIQLLFCFKPEEILRIIPNLYQKNLLNLRSDGSLVILLNFGFLWSDPLTHKFELEYDDSNFRILDSGVDLNFMLKEFEFINFDDFLSNRIPIEINPLDTSLLCNPILNQIIILAEDPSFYMHKGFDFFNLGISIVSNLKRREFARGGSTVTMQLVKNIFLDNNKSLVRKLEEVIITALIESYMKIEKNMILIIYLTLIKMSKNIYGIRAGAKYYFNKEITQLNIIESIVLTYIIPRPDFFEEAVKLKTDQLSRNLSKHIDMILERYFQCNIVEGSCSIDMCQTVIFANNIGEIDLKYSKYLTKC